MLLLPRQAREPANGSPPHHTTPQQGAHLGCGNHAFMHAIGVEAGRGGAAAQLHGLQEGAGVNVAHDVAHRRLKPLGGGPRPPLRKLVDSQVCGGSGGGARWRCYAAAAAPAGAGVWGEGSRGWLAREAGRRREANERAQGQARRRPGQPARAAISRPNHLCSPADRGAPRLVGGQAPKPAPRGAACQAAGAALRLCSTAIRRGLL